MRQNACSRLVLGFYVQIFCLVLGFYVRRLISWHYVLALRRPREQLLLLNYKTQRHAVLFKRYLNYWGWKIVKTVRSSVPQSPYKSGTPTQSVKISTLYHNFLIHYYRDFSYILRICTMPLVDYLVSIRPGSVLIFMSADPKKIRYLSRMKNCSRHANLSVRLFARDIIREVPPPKVKIYTLSQFSQWQLQGFLSYLAYMY